MVIWDFLDTIKIHENWKLQRLAELINGCDEWHPLNKNEILCYYHFLLRFYCIGRRINVQSNMAVYDFVPLHQQGLTYKYKNNTRIQYLFILVLFAHIWTIRLLNYAYVLVVVHGLRRWWENFWPRSSGIQSRRYNSGRRGRRWHAEACSTSILTLSWIQKSH